MANPHACASAIELIEKIRACAPRDARLQRLSDSMEVWVRSQSHPDSVVDWSKYSLSRQERRFVEFLYSKLGREVARECALTAVYYDHTDVPDDKILDVMVCKIRKRLVKSVFSILNERGFGFRMIAIPGLERFDGQIDLPPMVRPVLDYLALANGQFCAREDIVKSVYGDRKLWANGKSIIEQSCRKIREELKRRNAPLTVEGHTGFGYRLKRIEPPAVFYALEAVRA